MRFVKSLESATTPCMNCWAQASSKHTGMAGYGGFQRLPCRTSFCGKSIRKVNEMDAGMFPASILYSHLSARRKSLIFQCLLKIYGSSIVKHWTAIFYFALRFHLPIHSMIHFSISIEVKMMIFAQLFAIPTDNTEHLLVWPVMDFHTCFRLFWTLSGNLLSNYRSCCRSFISKTHWPHLELPLWSAIQAF